MSTLQAIPDSHATAPQGRTVEPSRLRDWLARNQAILIDVREPDERLRESIAGSVSLPLARLTAHALPPAKGRKIVCQCESGRRSAEAVARLASAGVDALSMAGGIDAWKRQGFPVHSAAGVPISIMRQVQITVGFAVLLGTAGAWLLSQWLLIIPAFFGAGLLFAGASGTCALAAILHRMPWNKAFHHAAVPVLDGQPCCDTATGPCAADPQH